LFFFQTISSSENHQRLTSFYKKNLFRNIEISTFYITFSCTAFRISDHGCEMFVIGPNSFDPVYDNTASLNQTAFVKDKFFI